MEATTERLRIRDLSVDDLDPMVDLWSEPEVERWMTGFGPRSRAEVERWLLETIAFNETSPRESHNCAVIEVQSGETIGWIGFGPSSHDENDVNFGYALRAEFRGKGYGAEALRAVIRFCFDELGVDVFTGETAVGNETSARAMEKAGMRRGSIIDGQIQFRANAV